VTAFRPGVQARPPRGRGRFGFRDRNPRHGTHASRRSRASGRTAAGLTSVATQSSATSRAGASLVVSAAVVLGAAPSRLAPVECRRCARQLPGGRDDRSRGMQSSRRRPGPAEPGRAMSHDRASTGSSFRGRAGHSDRSLTALGGRRRGSRASGEERGRDAKPERCCFRLGRADSSATRRWRTDSPPNRRLRAVR
jgi:hypothetical protein